MFDGASATIGSTTFNLNQARHGGAIYLFGASSTLTLNNNSTLTGNKATYSNGGGIVNYGTATLTNVTLSTNQATNYGGGIYNKVSATLTNVTLNGNSTDWSGGSTAHLTSVTFSGHNAKDNGGGIYSSSGSAMGLYNATIVGNVADSKATGVFGGSFGGGIYNSSGTVNFQNTLLAYNIYVWSLNNHPVAEAQDCSGTLNSQGYNIVSETTNCTISGSFINASPTLGPLQNNGGPTHALLPGSRGIDEGQSGNCTDNLGAPLTTDQRGFPRPANGVCDIGAYEVQRLLMLPLIVR